MWEARWAFPLPLSSRPFSSRAQRPPSRLFCIMPDVSCVGKGRLYRGLWLYVVPILFLLLQQSIPATTFVLNLGPHVSLSPEALICTTRGVNSQQHGKPPQVVECFQSMRHSQLWAPLAGEARTYARRPPIRCTEGTACGALGGSTDIRARPTGEGDTEGRHEKFNSGHPQLPHIGGGPSKGEITSFFRFLEASMASQHHPRQQQQRPLPVSAAVDAVLFLAGCAMSPHCGLRISKAAQWRRVPDEGDLTSVDMGTSRQQRQQGDGWLLLCDPSRATDPPEALPLQAVTSLFTSLHQLLPRTIGSTGGPSESPKELSALAHALMLLLEGVLQRAAAEASVLPAAETVQRVSAVANALADWGKRDTMGGRERLTSLLEIAQRDDMLRRGRDGGPLQGPSGRARTEGAGAAALAAALQRTGAPEMPHRVLRAAADMLEASATAAAQALDGAELLQQQELSGTDFSVHPGQQGASPQAPNGQHEQQLYGTPEQQKKSADALRQLVAANAAWLPVYYVLMRLNGGIWLPALRQLAEAAASQTTCLIQLFLSQQRQQRQLTIRGEKPNIDEAQNSAWNAVGLLLYGEVQQLAVSLARVHSVKPLRGVRGLAAAAEAFDRYLSSQASSLPLEGQSTGTAAPASAEGTVSLLRPLLHTHEPPRDIKEAERRIRFFCSLVTLGANGRLLTSGVSVCLPSESQMQTLSPLVSQQEQQHHQPNGRNSGQNAEAIAETCARQLRLPLLQRLLFSFNTLHETSLVSRGLKVLRLRLETLTLQHLLRLHCSTTSRSNPSSSSTSRNSKHLSSSAATAPGASDRYTAELVGKALALLHKSLSSLPRGRLETGEKTLYDKPLSPGAQEERLGEGYPNLGEALYSLAAAATLWAAVTGFEKQSPEDVALLTFSLIPFWLQQNAGAGAPPLHTDQHVQHLRAAAAAARDRHEQQQQRQSQQEQQQTGLPETQLAELARSLRGVRGYFPGRGVGAPRSVNSVAVEFYLSELTKRRGIEFPEWPPPLLFLLAYNVLRLRNTRGLESDRSLLDSATAPSTPLATNAGAAAPMMLQQQALSWAAEAAAAQLLSRVIAAIEKGLTFPDEVNAWCTREESRGMVEEGPQSPATQQHQQLSAEEGAFLPADARAAMATADIHSGGSPAAAAGAARQCNVRFAGLREVGSFLWALSRAEGGYYIPSSTGATEAVQSTADPAALDADAPATSSYLEGHPESHKPLTIQEASRRGARALKRHGGFVDKLAVYCEAAIREANNRLLQRSRAFGAEARSSEGKRHQQQTSACVTAAPAQVAAAGDVQLEDAVKALEAFCKEAPETCKPAVSLRPSDLPSLSWISTAGVSLGLLLNFSSSCRPDTRHHILSAVLHAPLLAVECGLLQLFHLLRQLGASTRAELVAAGEDNSMASTVPALGTISPSSGGRAQHSLPSVSAWQQKNMQGSSHSSGILGLLKEAPAFIFAVAIGLLRHAQAVANLPLDVPRTAAQVQLLLLATSDFAVLLQGHRRSVEASQGVEGGRDPRASRPALVTASNSFRSVLQELLSLFSSIVVRHSGQICGSLALLAAAAEVFSHCGRQVPLPSGSKKAMEAFAPAAIAALRQPSSSHLSRKGLSQESGWQGQRVGGAEDLQRLAAALEALKFVELK